MLDMADVPATNFTVYSTIDNASGERVLREYLSSLIVRYIIQ